MKIIILLIISFLFSINCELSIISPSELLSQYGNRPIDIVFRKMLDSSNFYVHGEIFFENKTLDHTACQDLGILQMNQIQINIQKILKYYLLILALAL